MAYTNPAESPAIRQHTRDNPTDCPWCGARTWFVSSGDDSRDNGRVEMYCDNSRCHSRETELIVTRGEGAHARADVRALHKIESGEHSSDQPAVPDVLGAMDDDQIQHVVERRHSNAQFQIVPTPEGGDVRQGEGGVSSQ